MLLQQKIPAHVIPEDIKKSGDIKVVWHPEIVLTRSYTISQDGWLIIHGFNELLFKKGNLTVGSKLLLLLFIGEPQLILSISYVPTLPAIKDTSLVTQLLV